MALFQSHRILIVIMLLLMLLFSAPHLVMIFTGQQYRPFFNGDELGYSASIQEVVDGHVMSSSPETWEHKREPAPYPWLSHYILGQFAKIIGTLNLFIVSDFIFPSIIFLLAYLLVYFITKESSIAIFAGLVHVIGWEIIYIIDDLMDVDFHWLKLHLFQKPFFLSRLEPPLFTEIFLLGAILFTYLAIFKKNKTLLFFSSLLGGSLFYIYPYSAYFFGMGLLLLTGLFIVTNNRIEAIYTFIIGVGSFIISLPYLFSAYTFMNNPNRVDLFFRQGGYVGHDLQLRIIIIVLPVIAIYLYLLRRRLIDKKLFVFIIAFLLAPIFLSNLHFVTGVNMQLSHWIEQGIGWASLAGGLGVGLILIRYNKESKRTLYIISIIILAFIAMKNISFALTNQKNYRLPKANYEITRWLNKHTKTDDVVMSTDLGLLSIVPTYTHDNVFVSRSYFSMISRREVLKRLIITFSLINQNNISIKNQKISQLLQYSLFKKPNSLRNAVFRKSQNKSLVNSLSSMPFRLDYIVITSNEYLYKQNSLLSFNLVKQIGNYSIYKVSAIKNKR